MNKNLIILLLLLVGLSYKSNAQIYSPVKWETSVKSISQDEYELQAKAIIEEGWHLYSQKIQEGGPNPTRFEFQRTNTYSLIGNVEEEKGKRINDLVFKMPITFFEKKALFTQKIKIHTNTPFKIQAETEFMVCNDQNCLPPSYEVLEFSIFPIRPSTANPTAKIGKDSTIQTKVLPVNNSLQKKEPKTKYKAPLPHKQKSRSLWTIFILSFLSGFAALLTPCVFPMIPMTVSFFTKQSKSKSEGIKKAAFYGGAIITIYIFLGAIVSWLFGADALNAMATNVVFNLLFFVILLCFAFSFLGAFEIILPHSLANKVDQQSEKSGIIGILFMALALAIVSFSCTGPIVGTLLVEAASGGKIAPFIGMLGFSLALALPFTLFAAFPGWLKALPKSGGWLNSVKVVLGFLELALALKFLSNADLVLQLHWLERETFLSIWIGIFATLTLYLFGHLKLPHDSTLTHISVGRLSLGILVFSFTIYMIPGIFGAPLELISGFPPPSNYSEIATKNIFNNNEDTPKLALPKGAELGPHNITVFTDYDLGMAYAKKIDKPVMIDFTGRACVNCRKMEDNVWSEEKILKILKNELVLISLYVDDKRELPSNEQVYSVLTGKKIKYIGQKWSEFQTITYKTNAQPFYALLNPNNTLLNETSGYNPDTETYYSWLKTGINKYKKNAPNPL